MLIAARYFQRWRTFGRRPTQALIDMYNEENLQQVVKFEDFREVMELIARCYSVPVEKLRTTDTFKTDLGDADSFSLDYGNECTARRLTKRFPHVNLKGPSTIRDLLVAIGRKAREERVD